MTARETEILVSGLEARPGLVSGELGGIYKTSEEVTNAWKEIGLEFSAEGLEFKTPKALIKKWTDLKYRVRKKARAIKRSRLRKGGGERSNLNMNPIEERVMNLAGPSTARGCKKDDIVSLPNPVLTLEKKEASSTPPVLDRRISLYQATPSTITRPLIPRVPPLALNHYAEQVPTSSEAVMSPTENNTSMDFSNSKNVDDVPNEISVGVHKSNNAYQTPIVKTFKRRKTLQAKGNFDKLLDVELRRLALEETRTELEKRKVEIKENEILVIKEQVQLLKENVAIARQQLAVSSDILSVLRNISNK